MGDRANIYVHEGDEPGVYLYTHWDGTELPETVRKSIGSETARSRWDDTAYLTRILFDAMTAGQQGGETGFGIATSAPDGRERVVDVDTGTAVISMPAGRWSFEEFAKLDAAAW